MWKSFAILCSWLSLEIDESLQKSVFSVLKDPTDLPLVLPFMQKKWYFC